MICGEIGCPYSWLIGLRVIPTAWQIAKLQDNNRALDRLTKSKEAALLEAERTVQAALTKASMVDDLQNRNQELFKQIEICQVIVCSKFLNPLLVTLASFPSICK